MRRRAMILWGAAVPFAWAAKRPARVTMEVRAKDEGEYRSFQFVLEADQPFPVRALDPVLHVGTAELESYRHAGLNTLVFSADPGRLKQGAFVFLQYGNDEESRWELGFYRGLTERAK